MRSSFTSTLISGDMLLYKISLIKGWLACLPSLLIIQVRIPQNPTVQSVKFVVEKEEWVANSENLNLFVK